MITWTKEEIQQFDNLVELTSSRNQVKRIEARLDMTAFIEKHTKPKCDAMWAHLEGGGDMVASDEVKP